MSLLEAVVATAILALVGVACLEGTQRALVLQQRAAQRAVALQQAEAALTAMALRVDARDEARSVPSRERAPQSLDMARQPYQPAWAMTSPLPLERVTVRVETSDGRMMQLTRLMPRVPAFVSATARSQP